MEYGWPGPGGSAGSLEPLIVSNSLINFQQTGPVTIDMSGLQSMMLAMSRGVDRQDHELKRHQEQLDAMNQTIAQLRTQLDESQSIRRDLAKMGSDIEALVVQCRLNNQRVDQLQRQCSEEQLMPVPVAVHVPGTGINGFNDGAIAGGIAGFMQKFGAEVRDTPSGVEVYNLREGAAANRAGLVENDIVRKAEVEVRSALQFMQILVSKRSGSAAVIEFQRGRELFRASLLLD